MATPQKATSPLSDSTYQLMLSDIYGVLAEGITPEERITKIEGIFGQYLRTEADLPRPASGEKSEDHLPIEEAIKASATEISRLAFEPGTDRKTLENTIRQAAGRISGIEEERSAVNTGQPLSPPPVRKARLKKANPSDADIERKVRTAMNSIYLEKETKIDYGIFSGYPVDRIEQYARDYLIRLLMGLYDTLDGSRREASKSHQLAAYDGLRAYLPFRGNDVYFLFNGIHNADKNDLLWPKNHPDWPIAETLIIRVSGTEKYTSIPMARLPFLVLLGEPNLRRMRGYEEHQRIIESGSQHDFKELKTLDYINQRLKSEVVMAAREIYRLPLSEED